MIQFLSLKFVLEPFFCFVFFFSSLLPAFSICLSCCLRITPSHSARLSLLFSLSLTIYLPIYLFLFLSIPCHCILLCLSVCLFGLLPRFFVLWNWSTFFIRSKVILILLNFTDKSVY